MMAARLPTPRYSIQHSRFTKRDGWQLWDLSPSLNGNIAVTGYNVNTRRTSIDVYINVGHSDSRDKPKIIYSKEFEKYSDEDWIYQYRYVSFIDNDVLVSCLGNKLEVFEVNKDEVLRFRRVNGDTRCLSVREGREIFIGLLQSNKITVYDVIDLNEIKSIILQGIQDGYWPYNLTAIADKIFVGISDFKDEGYRKPMILKEKTGRILSELTNPTDTVKWYAYGLALNLTLNVIAVAWTPTWEGESNGKDVIVFYSPLSENNCSFLIVESEFVVSGIRISDRGDRMIMGDWDTDECKVYDMSEFFSYGHLKENLHSQLQEDDCLKLTDFFALPDNQRDAIFKSNAPTENLLLVLEGKGVIEPSNVDRLAEAFTELEIKSSCSYLVDFYQKTRLQATSYGRFLATLSAHLTASSAADLCRYFDINDELKRSITSSPDPGLSLLLALDEVGFINPSEVIALKRPFSEIKLVQAKAKIHEYQLVIEEEKIQLQRQTELTEAEKKEQFIQCLQKTIQSWYDTMTPLPWKKSCRWKSTDLFVESGLVLTNSKAEKSLLDIDEECKLQYHQILNHNRLRAEKRIILEGEPGSGKTMMSSQLAYDWSQGKISEVDVLIFLPLKFVKNITLVEAVKRFYFPTFHSISANDIESFLTTEDLQSCLILDGFEEYNSGGMTPAREPSEVTKVMEKSKFPNCKVILTSRSYYTKDLPTCPMLRIGRFGEKERHAYIEKVFVDNTEKQQEIKRTIGNNQFILDLCRVPLLFVLAVHNIENILALQEGQLDRVAHFMESLVKQFCTSSDSTSDGSVSESEGDSDESLLEKFAFDGLCMGQQILSWQRNVLEASISNLKQFLDSGILFVEEGIVKENLRIIQDGKTHDEFSQNREKIERMKTKATGFEQMNQSVLVGTGVMASSFHQGYSVSEGSNENVTSISGSRVSYATETHISSTKRVWKRFSPRTFTMQTVLHSDRTTNKTGPSVKTQELASFQKEQADNTHSAGEYLVTLTPESGSAQLRPESQSESELSDFQKTSDTSTAKDYPLEVKFLHKVMQEWFASKHFSFLLWKSLSHKSLHTLAYKVLPQISPIDLQYILRFTSYLCPPSCPLIMDFLSQNHCTVNGVIPEYIMNCICLCFAECKQENVPQTPSWIKATMKENMDLVVAKLCREVIVIRSDDSRIIQQSKVAMLKYAATVGILIKEVHLVDAVLEVDETSTTLTSGVTFDIFNVIEVLEMSRWDQHLEQKDYQSIVKLVLSSNLIKKTRLYFPSQPPDIAKEALGDLDVYSKTVEWIIGPKLILMLNMETFQWEVTSDNSLQNRKVLAKVVCNHTPQSDDELLLVEDDIIEVNGQLDPWWWEGIVEGKKGHFPSHCVILLPADEDGKETKQRKYAPPVKARVKYDYDALEPYELTIKVGDIITDISMVEYGWWEGIVDGKRGMFPSNLVEEYTGMSNKIVRAKVVRSHKPHGEDELFLVEEDIVEIISQPDPWWWKGIVKGEKGYFPSYCVDLIQKDDEREETKQQEYATPAKAEVLHDYDAVEPDELTVKAGDTVTNIFMADGGWWEGVVNGKRGKFPSSFVKIHTELSEQSLQNKTALAKVTASYTSQSGREVSLVEGDVIEVTSQQDLFWWKGIVNGTQGQFPSHCVVPIAEDGEERKQQDYGTPDSRGKTILSAETTISNDGGLLQIQNTDIKLIIPPDALGKNNGQCLVRMRIIPPGSHAAVPSSFSSHSSTVLELLPNNLRFQQPVELTLPHCLKLKKDAEYKAKIFMSHHDGDVEPRWEEVTNHHYILRDTACTLWLNHFCWTKYEIDDEIVEAKRIQVYTAAKPICVPDDIAEIEVGYHLDLPGAGEILRLNPSLIIGQMRPFLFLREGSHPLRVSLQKIRPLSWKYSTPEENPKEISFRSVASSIEYSCPFLLEQDTENRNIPTCIFKASQNQNDLQLLIRPKLDEDSKHSEESLYKKESSLHLTHDSVGKEPAVCRRRDKKEDYDSIGDKGAYQTLEPHLHSNQTHQRQQTDGIHQRQLRQYSGQQPERNHLHIQEYHYSQHFNMMPIPAGTFGGHYGPHEPPWYSESDAQRTNVINYNTLISIARKLDPPDVLHNDWRMLAGELGFTVEDIALFERNESPTYNVITCAIRRSKLRSPEHLKSILTKMDRKDAADCISD